MENDERISKTSTLTEDFARGLSRLWMAYQPVVSRGGRVRAYEALMRTQGQALSAPLGMLRAAEALGRVWDLGRAVRAQVADEMLRAPRDVDFFVNLHPRDLLDDELYSPRAPLSRMGERVVLEITERESLDDIRDLSARLDRLRALGYRIALDDLGAGYAGLTSLAALRPEIVKLDMSLLRGIDRCNYRQSVVGAVTRLCHELSILVVAEGIETEAERDVAKVLSCDLLQGYLFGRPSPRVAMRVAGNLNNTLSDGVLGDQRDQNAARYINEIVPVEVRPGT